MTTYLPVSFSDLEPLSQYLGLLFDWDGTLADSQVVNFLSIRTALSAFGLAIEQEWFDARTGVSTREMASLVAEQSGYRGDLDVAAIVDLRDREYLKRLHEVSEVLHVSDVLRRHRGTRRIALATGGGAKTVLPTVHALGLDEEFDAIVTREDVEKGKPHPDIFLLAASRLELLPRHCLVYEDSDEGIAAATTAGMDVIDVRPLRQL